MRPAPSPSARTRSAKSGSVLSALAVLAATASAAEPVVLDGRFDEWAASDVLAAAPPDPAAGALAVGSVSARSAGATLYLRVDIAETRNIQSGRPDEGSVLVTISERDADGGPDRPVLHLDARQRRLAVGPGAGAPALSWTAVRYESAPTFASDRLEMRFDLAGLGVEPGDELVIAAAGGPAANLAGPEPAAYVLDAPAAPPSRRSGDRPDDAEFRLASLNTERTGLFNGSQGPAIRRLLDGADAEVYALQEEYNSSADAIKQIFDDLDPLGDGRPWNIHKNNDNVILSPAPLYPVQAFDRSYAAAVVDFGGGRSVLVLSVHPKCCGFIGSDEDELRIIQTEAMIQTVLLLRGADQTSDLRPFAASPVVIAGDWNLVGSRTPLTLTESELGLTDLLPRRLTGESTATWRTDRTTSGAFTPGRLDLIAADLDRLEALGSFVVETGELDPAQLASVGLGSAEGSLAALASDHLLLVADLAFRAGVPCLGDLTADGVVDVSDFFAFAAAFGDGSDADADAERAVDPALHAAADLDGSGSVDRRDLELLRARFGIRCPDPDPSDGAKAD